MKIEVEILLNKLAHAIEPIALGKEWFASITEEEQLEVLHHLNMIILQAGGRREDVEQAIKQSSLKATFTPCVLLTKGDLKTQLGKLPSLPKNERIKTFVLLIALLSIADMRRFREKCWKGCSHWWHEDLRKQAYISKNDL